MSSSVALAAMVAVLLMVAVLVLSMRRRDQHHRDLDRTSLRLKFPAELKADAVQAVIGALGGLPVSRHPHRGESTVAFELVAHPHDLRHYLRVPKGQAAYVASQLRALVPGVRVAEAEDELPAMPWAVELRLSNRHRQLRVDQPSAASASLLAAAQPLVDQEVVVLQWVIAPATVRPLRSDDGGRLGPQGWWRPLVGAPEAKPDPEVVKAARDKLGVPLFRAVGRVAVTAADQTRAGHLLWRVIGALRSLRQPGVTLRRRHLPRSIVGGRVAEARTPVLSYPARLNARELACLIAWPIEGPQIAGLAVGGSRELLPDPAVARAGRILGEATFPGAERPLALPEREALHHLHVIGPTGTGKSTLLANLILQDVEAGRGVVVIDPKGDLVADVLERIPDRQAGRVVLIDPTDDERPVGLNLLHRAHQAPELVTDQVISIFHQMYAAFWGPRTQDVLHASLLTLAAEPGLTLCELPLLLTNGVVRRRLVARVEDTIALGPFWTWYEQLKPGERAQALGPVMNKLRPLLLRRRVRSVIGQAEPTFTMDQVLAEPRVLLVSLAKGLLGPEAAALIGSLVMAQLWQAVQARAGIAASNRRPAFVYVDEFQDYLNLPTDIADVLAQARGFGVGLVLAHQHLGQLPQGLRHAVLANARSRVVFQTSADDAQVLARQLGGGLNPNDLQGLGAFEVYASLFAAGRVRSPASARTFPMPESVSSAERVRERSRLRYGRDRGEVEAAIRGRQQSRQDDGPIGRIRRQA